MKLNIVHVFGPVRKCIIALLIMRIMFINALQLSNVRKCNIIMANALNESTKVLYFFCCLFLFMLLFFSLEGERNCKIINNNQARNGK